MYSVKVFESYRKPIHQAQDGMTYNDIVRQNKQVMFMNATRKRTLCAEIPLTIVPSPFHGMKTVKDVIMCTSAPKGDMYGIFEYAVHLKKQRIDVTGKKPLILHAMVETKKHVHEVDSTQKRRPVTVLVPFNEHERLSTENELRVFQEHNALDIEEKLVERLNNENDHDYMIRNMSQLEIGTEPTKNRRKKNRKTLHEQELLCWMYTKR